MNRTTTAPPAADPWTEAMRSGDFAAAWQISDRALAARHGAPCWDWPRHLQSVWNGEPLAGKRILVRCYHGLGDTVQFIRFLPRLKEIAAEVVVWAQPALLPLLEGCRGIDRLLPLHDGVPEVGYDVDIELMELSHAFRVTAETLVAPIPYLRTGPARWVREHTAPAALAVGIAWRGGNWDPQRSIDPVLLAPLAEIPGVTWHILQQSPEPHGPLGSPREGASVEPVAELAAAIAALDLLITVDSLPAHLGGALGVRTWTLLPAEADWRWMRGRDDTPWYPTMTLFRQHEPGDWTSVIARVAKQLAELPRG